MHAGMTRRNVGVMIIFVYIVVRVADGNDGPKVSQNPCMLHSTSAT